ncbi:MULTISPECIES: M23 family metallopeptidase [unclassified Streptomyces]|uniref:M23 family metallopeptidase n=1 Tax=unclassified Streptomyces TaxID=2593676 RepID=UPI0001C19D69|nr:MULTISPECIES: M23 family metallopeptidase [unclassified Streptomyces]AEN12830.1 Peptidase M23 [Streptomyces sp. SirexAA-E]MYR66168.1 peptidoglycan DD-metalloendopeptidase family protein [Streptomyces sp. SID4939]MYS00758.1 peptidoglycan DD-metalloendopeptidase family protein [Streptomyces sp. SID4940]MYT65701.1 peptidoglycan DD-metalloendopeptidase family protein [Streptomyces sp. SID8357]MYT84263.1 peptidoglycan DD-metalloendopeptidase family protein [Streptomyces sp. SID8360]
MAFTRATGKHRAPNRLTRRSAQVAGIAALATAGVIGATASPALAADSAATVETVGLTQVTAIGSSLAAQIEAQAQAQRHQADLAAKAKAEAEAKAKAKAEAKRKAEARAEETRKAEARAARAAERARLNSFRLPVAGSYVTTAYKSGGSLWSSGSHSGVDFRAASGSSVVAVGAGTVVEAGWGGAYGNNIVLRMTDGTYTQYGHLSSIGVQVGQRVSSGQQIGLSGSTGNSTGPHLHFEARTTPQYGSDMDPVAYLRSHGVRL